MNKTFNRILSLILLLILTFSLATTALAAGYYTGNDIWGGTKDAIITCPVDQVDQYKQYLGSTPDEQEQRLREYKGDVSASCNRIVGSLNQTDLNEALNDFSVLGQEILSIMISFAFITAFLTFIKIFMDITWMPSHSAQRRRAMEDVVVAAVSTALTGGIWLFTSLFNSIMNRLWQSMIMYSKDWQAVATIVMIEYKNIVVGILGIATLTALLMFIRAIVTLNLSSANPSKRSEAYNTMLLTGIATAGLGSITLVTSLFWGILR